MAHLIELPIRFRFLKIPFSWALYSANEPGSEFLYGRSEPIGLTNECLTEMDGWQCREEFFSLKNNDNAALLKFLSKVGLFSFSDIPLNGLIAPYGTEKLAIPVSEVWKFRENLRNGLLPRNQKSFKAEYAPRLPVPKSLYEAIARPQKTLENSQTVNTPDSDFRLDFELTDVAAATVTVTNAHRMLLATAFVDIIRGLHFKVCARKDCNGGERRVFALESDRERKYCSQYCGHIESVRRIRREKRTQKR